MRALARLLDALTVGLGGLALAVLATGGWVVAGVSLTRPEDFVVALAAAVGIRVLVRPIELPRVSPDRAVLTGLIVYAVLMTFITVTAHQALRTHALDLGYYVQVVWNIATGRGARVTLPTMPAWGDHLSPVLYLFVPVAWVWPGATPLLVAQTVILAAGAVAVFQVAWTRLRERRLAAALALLYVLNPSVHGINIRDIHPQAFAIPLLIAAAAAHDARRYKWCAAAILTTLACREDAAVAVVGFGVWLACARRRWAVGAALALASVALLAVEIHLVMPLFRGAPYPHLFRYAHLGTSLGDILTSLVVRPWRWIGVVLAGPKLLYLLALLAPLGFLPLLAPGALVAALPGVAMNLMSLDPVLVNHRSQYQSFVVPFLVLAAVDGARRLRAWTRHRRAARLWSPAGALALGCLASMVLTARTVNDLGVSRWRLGPEQRAAHLLLGSVPPGVPVSANERLVPHLATRPEIYIFPDGLPRSQYIVDLGTRTPEVPGEYGMLRREGPWVLWRRLGPSG